jgi:hypothetical protein
MKEQIQRKQQERDLLIEQKKNQICKKSIKIFDDLIKKVTLQIIKMKV